MEESMQPDEPTTDASQENMPEDNQTPATPPTPPLGDTATGDTTTLDDTHPATDTGVDATEANDEGFSGTVETQSPGADSNPAQAVDSAPKSGLESDVAADDEPPANGEGVS
jgi:hypothetical protein